MGVKTPALLNARDSGHTFFSDKALLGAKNQNKQPSETMTNLNNFTKISFLLPD